MLGLFLTAFPPLVGYSSLVTMSGYVYGFGFGLFIAYTSALLGSIACFYLCRRWFKVQVRALMAKKQSMKSVVKAVEKRGFKLMLLIRLAPYPFNVMNALLSATHIPLSTFALATAISLIKLALHVYIGSTLSSLAVLPPPPLGDDGDTTAPLPDPADGNSHGRALKIVVMVFSMIIGFAVGAYVWIVAKREIEASEGIRTERRRKRRESMRLSRVSMRSSSGGVSGNVAAALAGGRGSGRAEGNNILARSGSSGGLELLSSSDRVPVVDLAGVTALGDSDFVGGVAGGTQYMDYDEGQEDQALVGRHDQHTSERALPSPLEYGTDSELSDFLDDDDENMSDMERGVEDTVLFQQDETEMSVRSPTFPLLQQGSQRAAERETMGWFADNGVDISDGW
ncbi:hypothetical protein BGZ58_007359 [Dissophora ornata]|nr:hypothetical protein BGZ58_007359 [Dissophora ornata]